MPTFPGMNPYLESPAIWEGVHARLVVAIANLLQPALDPRYIASVEERVFIEGPSAQRVPDVFVSRLNPAFNPKAVEPQQSESSHCDIAVVVELEGLEIHQKFIEILDTYNGMKLITIIELLSPVNKRKGPGEDSYRAKQSAVLESECHLVEIDLLRSGRRILSVPDWKLREIDPFDYITCVSRSANRSRFELYPTTLQQRLPRVAIPLSSEDLDVPLNLQEALSQVLEQGRYEKRLRYDEPCDPPLTDQQRTLLF